MSRMRTFVTVLVIAGVLSGLGGPGAAADEPATESGSAITFGDNTDGKTEVPRLPVGVRYTDGAADNSHTVLLRSDGEVEAFGSDLSGQTRVPELPEGVTYTGVAAGLTHTVLLRSDGQVEAFGSDLSGQTRVPELPEGVTYTDVSAGSTHTVLMRSDGQVEAFGSDSFGKTRVPSLPEGVTYTGVSAGDSHTVLLRSDGQVEAFGSDVYGETLVPSLPEGVTFADVAAGYRHTVLLRSDGEVEAFGDDEFGQTRVPSLPEGVTYTDVAGAFHTVMLRSDGEVEAFGDDRAGQTRVPSLPEGMTYTGVVAGEFHTVLLRSAVDTEVMVDAPASIEAGEDEVRVSASVAAAGGVEPGVDFSGTVRFTVSGQEPVDVDVDEDGDAATTIDELPTTAGATVDVSATYLGSTNGAYLASSAPGEHTIEVTAAPLDAIEVSPAEEEVVAGESVEFSVGGRDEFGNDVGDLTDSVTFGASGADVKGDTVTFTEAGSHTVTATSDADPELTASVVIEVAAAPLATIELGAPDGLDVADGESLTFTVEGADAYGNQVEIDDDAIELSSDQPDDVVEDLTVTFAEGGPHVITATVGGLTDAVTVEVAPGATTTAWLPATGAGSLVATAIAAVLALLLGAALMLTARRTSGGQRP